MLVLLSALTRGIHCWTAQRHPRAVTVLPHSFTEGSCVLPCLEDGLRGGGAGCT